MLLYRITDPAHMNSKRYWRAVYFVLVGVTTVGYGDIVPITLVESSFVTILILIGGLGYPAVIGAIASLMSNVNAQRSEFNRNMRTLSTYMDQKNIPSGMFVFSTPSILKF